MLSLHIRHLSILIVILFVRLLGWISHPNETPTDAYKFTCRYEGALDPWMSALWNMLYEKNRNLLPNGPDFVAPDADLIDQPRLQIIYHDAEEGVAPISTTTG